MGRCSRPTCKAIKPRCRANGVRLRVRLRVTVKGRVRVRDGMVV